MQNVVPRLSATPGSIGWVGPELGEHNDEVFGDILQMPADEQTYLRGLNVI
jgi:formyl-CoA transferase